MGYCGAGYSEVAEEASVKRVIAKGAEDSVFKNLLSQCGLKAIVVLTSYYSPDDTEADVMRNITKDLSPKYLQSLLAKKSMNYEDIVVAMERVMPDKRPDFRYNNHARRDIRGKLFHSNLSGITAMKFNGTSDLHWAVLVGGRVLPLMSRSGIPDSTSYDNMKDIQGEVKEFDGFGHTIIFRSPDDVTILEHFEQCSRTHCRDCVRSPWCLQRRNATSSRGLEL